MNKFRFFCLSGIFLFNVIVQAGEKQNEFMVNHTVVLTGQVVKTGYLSVRDRSKKEYHNEAYCLKLEKNIAVSDDKNLKKIYRNITLIELQNYHDFNKLLSAGKIFKITGILKTFVRRPGFYRQYSTPIQMRILEVD